MKNLIVSLAIGLLWCATSGATTAPSGLVESSDGGNSALLVGVPENLPGIDKDLEMMTEIVSHPEYRFHPSYLWKEDATAKNVLHGLTTEASAIEKDGTFLFYYSGHGDVGELEVYDRPLKITEIREALVAARAEAGPLSRLVLIFDSCHAGSLIDPVDNASFADQVMSQFDGKSRYWKKLFIFSSSLATELSDPSDLGSIFTLALYKAFKEVASNKSKLKTWVEKTKEYTESHHPIERVSPPSLYEESIF